MNTNYDAHRTHSMVDRLASLQVPGAAFLTSQVDPPVREALARRGICGVYLEHDITSNRISNIAIDYRFGIFEAVRHLFDLGHRAIGFVGGPAHGSSARRRKHAFLDAAEAVGIETRVVDSDFTVQGGYFACSRLLNSFGATALMAANDLMAIGAMHFAYDRHIRVPAELSVVGFDDITFSQFTQPALTTVNVPRIEIGRLAFEALSALINDPQVDGRQYEVKTSLVIRQSTAAPAAAPIS